MIRESYENRHNILEKTVSSVSNKGQRSDALRSAGLVRNVSVCLCRIQLFCWKIESGRAAQKIGRVSWAAVGCFWDLHDQRDPECISSAPDRCAGLPGCLIGRSERRDWLTYSTSETEKRAALRPGGSLSRLMEVRSWGGELPCHLQLHRTTNLTLPAISV